MSAATTDTPDATIGAILAEIVSLAETTAELITDATAHGTKAAERLVLHLDALADAGCVLSGGHATRGGVAGWTAQFLEGDPAQGSAA